MRAAGIATSRSNDAIYIFEPIFCQKNFGHEWWSIYPLHFPNYFVAVLGINILTQNGCMHKGERMWQKLQYESHHILCIKRFFDKVLFQNDPSIDLFPLHDCNPICRQPRLDCPLSKGNEAHNLKDLIEKSQNLSFF